MKRINYTETVQQKVFERMISERRRIAEAQARSEGQGRARRDPRPDAARRARRELAGLQVRPGAQGRRRRQSDGDLRARLLEGIPTSYQFWKAMETLEASLDDKAWLILSTDSELFRYLKSGGQP